MNSATSRPGFAEADFIREDITFYEGSTHLALEQHASVAQFLDGKITLWSSTQDPHYLHRALASVLGLPASHIRVIATPCGGGFGGKCDPFQHEIIVCKLAMVTGRPVKICLTREEVFYCHRGRHPVLMWTKTGFKQDGTITAMHHSTFLDGGAYGGHGAASTFYTGVLQPTTYTIGEIQIRRGPRVHQQSSLRPEARTRHPARRASPRKSRWTRSPSSSAWTRPSCACGIWSRRIR